MDKNKCPISEMSKNFPEKINVVTIKYFYGLLTKKIMKILLP